MDTFPDAVNCSNELLRDWVRSLQRKKVVTLSVMEGEMSQFLCSIQYAIFQVVSLQK